MSHKLYELDNIRKQKDVLLDGKTWVELTGEQRQAFRKLCVLERQALLNNGRKHELQWVIGERESCPDCEKY
jgi:hypothetical protein